MKLSIALAAALLIIGFHSRKLQGRQRRRGILPIRGLSRRLRREGRCGVATATGRASDGASCGTARNSDESWWSGQSSRQALKNLLLRRKVDYAESAGALASGREANGS